MLRPAPCQLGYIRENRPKIIQFGADRPHPTLRGTSSQSALMYTPADRNPYSLLLPGEAGHQGDATSGNFSPAGFLKWRRPARGEKHTGHSPITGHRPPQLDACRYPEVAWEYPDITFSSDTSGHANVPIPRPVPMRPRVNEVRRRRPADLYVRRDGKNAIMVIKPQY